MDNKEIEFRPSISVSDKLVKSKVSPENWEKLKSETFRRDNYTCLSCSFEPFDIEPDKVLDIHVISENLENVLDSEVRTTCTLCHFIEHIDSAIGAGYISLVNSHLTQGQLVNICRNNSLSEHIENGDVRFIKKPLHVFIEEVKNGTSLEGKVKVVFTDKFLKQFGIS